MRTMRRNKKLQSVFKGDYEAFYYLPQLIRDDAAFRLFHYLLKCHFESEGRAEFLSIVQAERILDIKKRLFLKARDYLAGIGIISIVSNEGRTCGYMVSEKRLYNIIYLINQSEDDRIVEIAESLERGDEAKLIELGYSDMYTAKYNMLYQI